MKAVKFWWETSVPEFFNFKNDEAMDFMELLVVVMVLVSYFYFVVPVTLVLDVGTKQAVMEVDDVPSLLPQS